MYFSIGYLFIGNCSDYLNFQDSAKNENKNIQRVQKRKRVLCLFSQRENKIQIAKPSLKSWIQSESNNSEFKCLEEKENNSKVLQNCISWWPFTSSSCVTVLNKTQNSEGIKWNGGVRNCYFLTDIHYHKWGYKPRFKCNTCHELWISKVWEAEKHLLLLQSVLDIFAIYTTIFFSILKNS